MQPGDVESPFPLHFDGKRFYNPNAPQARGLRDVLRWQLARRAEQSPKFIADVTPSKPPQLIGGDEVRVTLVNHSTVLLQQNGFNILTDPIWSERCSPFSWAGPRRHRVPGVLREDLPRIHLILLSHNHYDHLDLPSLRWLARRGDSTFVVPLGVAKLLRSQKIGSVHELDWGDSHTINETNIHAVPALHFSARSPFDRNKTLWCGYVIQSQNRTIYFAGDTGFGEHFSLILQKFGAPSLSLLPIGAYKPRWFMGPIHMAPEDALKAHQILGSRLSIAIHHGTFQLCDDALDEAKREIVTSPARPKNFLILNNGETTTLND